MDDRAAIEDDDLIGAQFKINNPNVTASCGCGTSFFAVSNFFCSRSMLST